MPLAKCLPINSAQAPRHREIGPFWVSRDAYQQPKDVLIETIVDGGRAEVAPESHPPTRRRHDRALALIAVFKFVKVVLLIAVGLGALGLVRDGVTAASRQILSTLSSGV